MALVSPGPTPMPDSPRQAQAAVSAANTPYFSKPITPMATGMATSLQDNGADL